MSILTWVCPHFHLTKSWFALLFFYTFGPPLFQHFYLDNLHKLSLMVHYMKLLMVHYMKLTDSESNIDISDLVSDFFWYRIRACITIFALNISHNWKSGNISKSNKMKRRIVLKIFRHFSRSLLFDEVVS